MSAALLETLIGVDETLTTTLPARPLRVGIYCRISADDEKDGKGVARQRADCLKLQRERYPTVEWSPELYIDNDVSAMGAKEREHFERLLRDIIAGRLDVVIVWHTDRLYRRIEELSRIMAAWQHHRPEIAAVTVGKVDFTTPTGRMLARMMAIVGQYEVEHLVERIQRKKEELRMAGKVQGGGRPFGYRDGGYEIEPREAARIRTAARRILVGRQSLGDIAREWNRAGVPTVRGTQWNSTKVRRVLVRHRNVGIVEHKGKPVAEALWPPVLDAETWAGLRAKLGEGRPPRKRRAAVRSLLGGLALCGECGASLYSAGPDPRGAPRYRCSASTHLKRVATPIDEYVEQVVVGMLANSNPADLIGRSSSAELVTELHAQAAARQAKRDEALDMFSEGEITRAEYRAIAAKADAYLDEIEAQLAELSANSVLDGMLGADVVNAWDRLDLDRRRAIIDHLVTVTVHRGLGGGDRRSKDRMARFHSTVQITPKVRPETS